MSFCHREGETETRTVGLSEKRPEGELSTQSIYGGLTSHGGCPIAIEHHAPDRVYVLTLTRKSRVKGRC
eukprot:3281602-Prymnesium_polylepis.1